MNCPECNKPLEEEEEGLVCWNCNIVIPLDNENNSNYSMRKEMNKCKICGCELTMKNKVYTERGYGWFDYCVDCTPRIKEGKR